MSSRPPAQEKLPKKDRKALARELARLERERQARRRRRNRRLGWAGAGTAVVAVGVIAALAVQASVRAGQVGPHNMLSDGVVLTGDGSAVAASRTSALDPGASPVATVVDRSSGVLDLVLYLDYRSPEAETFWAANSASVEQWVTAGYATLEIHPLALLDGAAVSTGTGASPSPSATASPAPSATASASADDSLLGTMQTTGDYSARAAGALACVADTAPDSVLAVHDALLAAQPDLDEDGLTDDDLVALVQNAGVTDTAVADCVTNGDFTDWAQEATTRAADSVPYDVGSVTTSPVVLVGGQQYTGDLGDADALLAFIEEVSTQLAAEAAEAEASASPSASPTESPIEGASQEPSASATETTAP
ncbi:thioredoxin domain-containing protein [Cellulomonas sp. GbtcB1]|uniref:DsbA family protein n=1 Tax=Cellulomonas sp. GbtcB1 TaxID=2824746 RepID=UPI001C30F567|nr:thioredoxin domain-containing protein [Cellulomonas sp. GbtcB1]